MPVALTVNWHKILRGCAPDGVGKPRALPRLLAAARRRREEPPQRAAGRAAGRGLGATAGKAPKTNPQTGPFLNKFLNNFLNLLQKRKLGQTFELWQNLN